MLVTMRRLVVLPVLAISGGAFASFDLMLLPDTATGRVHRYDPINQISLGSIVVQPGLRSVAANASSTAAFGQSNNGTVRFNWSTGERGNSPAGIVNPITLSNDGQRIFEVVGNSVKIYTASTYSSSLVQFNANSVLSVNQTGANRFVVTGVASNGDLVAFNCNSALGLVSTATLLSAGTFSEASSVQGVFSTIFSIPFATQVTSFVYKSSSGQTILSNRQSDGQGGILSTVISDATLTGFNASAANAAAMILPGHAGFFVVGTSSAGNGTRIQEFSVTPTLVTHDYVVSGIVPPTTGSWRAANIVAPEPASLAALAIGALGFWRRRKTRRAN